jgi:hypothetical protein
MMCASAQHTMTFHDLAFLGAEKRSTSTSISPTNIVGNPAIAWYVGSTYNNTTWPDSTTNGYTLTERASTLTKPTSGGTIGGYTYVVFTNNYLENTALTTDATNSIYVVMAPDNAEYLNWEYIVSCPTNNGFDFTAFTIKPDGTAFSIWAGGFYTESTVGPIRNEWAVYTLDCEGTNFNLFKNNTNILSDTLTTDGKFLGISVGADRVQGNGDYAPFRGKIAEIIVYDSIVPFTYRSNLVVSLYNKYGLSNPIDSGLNYILDEGGNAILDEGGNALMQE